MASTLGAFACGGSTSEADLARPAYVLHLNEDLCASTFAVDADQNLWKEGSCQNGSTLLKPNGTVTPEQYQRIAAAFAAHPDPASFSDPACSSPALRSARFTEYRADGSSGSWDICDYENGQLVYPAPFDQTAAAMER